MKIKANVQELKIKIRRALEVIPTKTSIPILAYAKLAVTSDNKATISSSDLGISMIQSVTLEADQAGAFLLPTEVVADMLSCFPSDAEVTLESETVTESKGKIVREAILLNCGRFKAELPGVLLSLFPAFDQKPETQYIFNTDALKTLIERVDFAAPDKAGRHSVPSVQIESDDTKLRAVATDGHRIAVADAPGQGAGNFSFQLPKTALGLIKALPGATIAFSQSENNFFFQGDAEEILIRKPTAKFPPYQRAFLQPYRTEIKMPKTSLKNLIKAISPILDKDNPAVNIELTAGELTMSGSSLKGNASHQLKVEMTGEDIKIRINPVFVLEFLKHAEDTITINLESYQKLVKFTSEARDYQYFVQPMQDPLRLERERQFDEAWEENRKREAERARNLGVVPVQS